MADHVNTMRPARGRAHARATLLGNPSDGFGGATLGFTIAELGAEVALRAADGTPPEPLVAAALERYGAPPQPASVRSDIPREVGLAGSSAIVIATLRALGEAAGAPPAPGELARLALAVERDDLAIEGGAQDPLVQAYGGLLYMDFADDPGGACEALDPALLPPLFVAWRRDGGRASGQVHAELRRRVDAGGPGAATELAGLAELTARGRELLIAGDRAAFARLIDATADARARLLDLDPADWRLVELAREHGAAANYAGSGGAIVGTIPAGATAVRLGAAFAAAGYGFTPATPTR